MTELGRYYHEAIEKLLHSHRLEPKRARAYLESIASQIGERFPGIENREFVRAQIAKASLLSLGYENPVAVLRDLDSAVERYLKMNVSFRLFEDITPSTPAKPMTLDDLEEEIDLLLGIKNNS